MKKKTLTIAIALVLVVALAVGATYAYLTATTGEVKNTFAVGNVIDNTKFALQEHKVAYNDTKGVYDYVLTEAGEKQVATSNTYDKLVPGTTAPKDPVYHHWRENAGSGLPFREGHGYQRGHHLQRGCRQVG